MNDAVEAPTGEGGHQRRSGRRLALRLEAIVGRLRPPRRGPPLIEPYRGYVTPDALVLRGRCLTAQRRAQPDPEQSRWTNVRQMVSLFLTSEVADVVVTGGGGRATTDEEGYFTIRAPRPTLGPGWHQVAVRIEGRPETATLAPVLAPSPAAPCLVVSDIDDTVLETGAYSLARNLWTSLTGNARTRHVFDDTATLLRAFQAADAPIFYVSSSPWNLHHFLGSIFAHHEVPAGPMFLRDLGINERPAGGGGHMGHKSAAIDAVLAANPTLRAVLVGDTGQEDARVYAAVATRWPERVRLVLLREPRPAAHGAFAEAFATLEAAGVAVFAGPRLDVADAKALVAHVLQKAPPARHSP